MRNLKDKTLQTTFNTFSNSVLSDSIRERFRKQHKSLILELHLYLFFHYTLKIVVYTTIKSNFLFIIKVDKINQSIFIQLNIKNKVTVPIKKIIILIFFPRVVRFHLFWLIQSIVADPTFLTEISI